MKKEDVPQDKSSLSKCNLQEVVYAVDKDGKYTKALSSGWEVKSIVLNESLDLIKEQLIETIERIKKGEQSPIAYYMELQRMDVPVLAGYAGLWQWKVKRHLKARIFNKLSERILKKYADAFDITISELKNPKI